MIDHGQPIDAWAAKQKDLTAEDKEAVKALRVKGYHTVGDLQHLADDKSAPRELAAKVKKALGK